MTTTYYPQPAAAPRPFERAYPNHEFGHDEPRPVMHDNFPAAMPQPPGPSRTASALRSGVLLLGAVAAVGAGVLIGVTLFDKDESATPIQPVYLVPGADGNPAASPAPVTLPPQEPQPVVVPPPSGVPPRLGSDFTVTVPVPPAGNPTPAPAPVPAAAPPPASVQQAPGPILVPFPIKTEPEPPKPAPPAPPKADPKIEPPAPKIDPNKLDPTKDAKVVPPVDPNKLDPTIDPPGPGAPKIDPTPGPKLEPPVPNPAEQPCAFC